MPGFPDKAPKLKIMKKVMNFEEQFNSEFQKSLTEDFVPFPIPGEWFERAILALEFASTLKLGVTGDQFLELIEAAENKKLTLLQFAILSNNLEERSPRDLGITKHEYGIFMALVADLSRQWKEITDVTRDAIMQTIIQKQAVETNGLKPVKN